MNDYNKLLEDYTCVILDKTNILFTSQDSGVKPILDFYHQYGPSTTPLTVVDKIMGRSAVLLAKLINANKIYTPIISEDALSLAKFYDIECTYNSVVPYIINRDKTGRCPIEASVLGVTDVLEGYSVIIKTLQKLSKKD